MPEVKNVQALYKVEFTEYERGWGSKPWDVKFFDNEAEARACALVYNDVHNKLATTPDWYVRADYVGCSVLTLKGKSKCLK